MIIGDDIVNIDVKKVKICVNVPCEDVEKVRNAICGVGAGIIGNYSYCTSSCKTVGTFIPNENASPHIGKKNKLEIVEGYRLEAICDVCNVKNVVLNLKKVHPYEEPGIDIIPLIDENDLIC